MFITRKEQIYSGILLIGIIVVLAVGMTGCTPDEKCTDIRLKIEEDGYLAGWEYVKDISSLDDETNPIGRILYALYTSEKNAEEYAVLRIVKQTTPNSFSGSFVTVIYDENSNSAKSLGEESKLLTLDITYDSEIVIKSK